MTAESPRGARWPLSMLSARTTRVRRGGPYSSIPPRCLVTSERGDRAQQQAVGAHGEPPRGRLRRLRPSKSSSPQRRAGAHEERVLELYGPPRRTLVFALRASTMASAPSG